MATYAIGDIQGCYDELLALFEQIDLDKRQDQLLFVGDLVNRGPKSLDSLRLIKDLCQAGLARTVLGNHDLHLLALWRRQIPAGKFDNLQPLLNAEDADELCQWLCQQPLFLFDPEQNFCVAHAGLYPGWSPQAALNYANEVSQVLQSEQRDSFLKQMYGNQPACWSESLEGQARWRFITNALTRMRFCSPQGELELDSKDSAEQPPAGCLPWFQLPVRSPDTAIIFGHWAALRDLPDQHPFYATDTGCVWGAKLTALRLEDKQRFHVASQQPQRR